MKREVRTFFDFSSMFRILKISENPPWSLFMILHDFTDCFEYNVDFNGGNLERHSVTADTPIECRRLCINNFDCEIFTWTEADRSCSLKSSDPQKKGKSPWRWDGGFESSSSGTVRMVSGSAFCPHDENSK